MHHVVLDFNLVICFFKHLRYQIFFSVKVDTISSTLDGNASGYILEVDLHFPVELHDKLTYFPPALETLTPDIDWLTPYQREIGANAGIIHNGFSMALISWSRIYTITKTMPSVTRA